MEKITRENAFEQKKEKSGLKWPRVSTNQLLNNWALGITVSGLSKEKLKTRCIMGDVQMVKIISWPSYFLGINRESVSSHTFINCILELQTFSSGKGAVCKAMN